MGLKRRHRKKRLSHAVTGTTTPYAEEEYIFSRQLIGANKLQRAIWKFSLGLNQREPSCGKVG